MTAITPPTAPAVSLAKPKEIWNTMPGWGIVTNLIPPELIAARKLRVVRRMLGIILAFILVLALLAYGWAWTQHGSAQDDLNAAQDRTSELSASQGKYQTGVRVQSNITAISGSLSTLMATDVDTATLLGDVRAQLPADMVIGAMSLNIVKNSTDTAGAANPANVFDNGTQAHIGTITLSGTAKSITLVSSYVDRLGSVPGVVQPFLANVSSSTTGINWNITLTVTAARLTHLYDSVTKGSK